MGEVYNGIDRQLAQSLGPTHKFQTFIETGTFHGRTTEWAAHSFKQVFSVDRHPEFVREVRAKLEQFSRVKIFEGDSLDILPQMLASISGIALIWLDAHWSRDLGWDKPEVICPVLEEIEIIRADGRKHIIFVDDARLFGILRGWPEYQDVKQALSYANRSVIVINDIFVSIP